MKKLVQRFALLALMLLPMLASATVTNAVPTPAARGSVTIGNAQGGAAFDTVYANPNPGYKVSKWLNGSAELSEIPGEVVFDGNKILLDATQTWNITCVFGSESYTVSKGSLEHGDITGELGEWPYGKLIHITAEPEDGYQFDSWADDPTAPADRYVHVTGTATLSATFVPATYNLNITTNDGSDVKFTVTVMDPGYTILSTDEFDLGNGDVLSPVPVSYGNKASVSVTTNGHFTTPINWVPTSGSSLLYSGNTSYTISSFPATDVTLDIQLSPANVIITASSILDELGTVTGAGTVGYGETVQLGANPETGYVFDHWVNTETGTTYDHTYNPLVFTATTDSTFTAYFEPERYHIALDATPNDAATFTVKNLTLGTDAVAYNEYDDYPNGTGLQITAVPAPHFQFDKWSDESTLNPRTVYVWSENNVDLTALFVPDSHTVTVVSDAKGAPTPSGVCGHVAHDSVFNVTVVAANEDEYVFDHWEDANGNTVTMPFTVVSDTTITAVYLPVQYTVTAVINAGDETKGTISPATQLVDFGQTVTLTATPNTGYNFKKWSEPTHFNDSTDAVIHPTIDVSNASHTYEWTASFGTDEFKVTVAAVDAAYGITLDPSGVEFVSYGNTITVAEDVNTNPTMYYVAGFTDNHDNVLTMPLTVTQDTTVIAVIDSVEYDLTLSSATIDGKTDTVLKYNTPFTLTPDAPAAGKTFKSWTVDGVADVSTDPAYEFTMNDDDMEIEAVYEDVTYTVTVVADPTEGGDVTGTATGVAHGASVTITAAAKAHYTFTGWNDGNNDLSRNITVVSDTTFTATFAAESYTITLQANDPVMGTVEFDDPTHATVEYNTVIRPYLVAHPNPDGGYYLVRWEDQNGVEITDSYKIASNITATAIFGYSTIKASSYVVEYGEDTTAHMDAAWGSISKSGVEVYTGEITITFTPSDAHHVFMGWTDGVDATVNPRTVILTRDTNIYAMVALDSHTVAYATNAVAMGTINGNGNASGTLLKHGTEVHLVAEPTAHHHFVNWSAGSGTADTTFNVVDDVNLTATFAIDQVIVTVNNDGNGTATGAGTYDWGNSVTLQATATAEGYEFDKWVDASSNEATDNPLIFQATQDTIWTATFKKAFFSVAIDEAKDDDNEVMGTAAISGVTPNAQGKYEYGSTLTFTATESNPGYHFVKWTYENGNLISTDNPYTAFAVGAQDYTIKQVYAPNQFDVSVAADGEGTVSGAATGKEYKTTVALTAEANPGYVLNNWTSSPVTETKTGANIEVTVPASNITWTAHFVAGEYEVAGVVADACTGMGTVSGTTTATYGGSPVTLTATANEGYHFVNWDNNDLLTDNEHAFDVGVTNTSHTAYFAPNTYTLTIATNFPVRGHVEESDVTVTSKTVSFGEEITLEAISHSGYDFENWTPISGTVTTTNPLTFTYNVNHDTTITANFKYHQWTVAATGTNGATVTGAGTFSNGAEAILEATPATHYTVWKGWKNEADAIVSTDNPLTVTVLSDTTLTAVYDVDTHTVTFVADPSNRGTIESDDTVSTNKYPYGTELTVVATPVNEHYLFDGWVDDATATATRTITVEGDVDYTANFVADQYLLTVGYYEGSNSDMGVISSTPATGTNISYGDAVVLSAVANTGYEFVNWVDANGAEVSDDPAYNFTMEQATALYAVFSYKTFTITINTPVKEMGYVEVRNANGETIALDSVEHTITGYQTHTNYTVIATPKYGYTWSHWTGDNSGTDSLFTTSNNDNTNVSYVAYFAYEQFNVNLTANSDARGTVSGAGTYSYANIINISATPEAGFHFVRWNDNNTENPRSLLVQGDTSIMAVFAYDPISTTLEDCDEVKWTFAAQNFDTTITTSGVYSHTFSDVLGEDSVVNNTVTVKLSTTGIDAQSRCYESLTWLDGETYNESNNTATWHLTNVAGCDSLVTLNFTYFENLSKDTVVEACNPFTWAYTGLTYDTEGDHVTGPVADVNGCDSTTSLHLTFTTPKDTTYTTTACDEFVWTIAGTDHVYTATGDDSFVFTDVNQCTATATIHVTINHSSSERFADVDACDEYAFTWTNDANAPETFTATNEYLHEYTSVEGCPSVDTVNVTIRHNSNTRYTAEVACDELVYTWANSGETETFTVSDEYYNDYTSAENCPSTDTVVVTINNNTNTVLAAEDVCDVLNYTWANDPTGADTVITTSGTYHHKYNTTEGCPSTDDITVTIRHNSNTKFADEEACDEMTYTWANDAFDTVILTSGTYLHNYTSAENCPSTDTVIVTINNNTNTVFPAQDVCDQYAFAWTDGTDTTITTSGTYTHSYLTTAGCPSTDEITVAIRNKVLVDAYAEACDTYEWNGLSFTQSGNIAINGVAANGCDSVTTLHLTIQQTSITTLDPVAVCDQYTWEFNGTTIDTYTTGGNKTYEYAEGLCEHNTVTLPLTINTLADVEETAAACDTYIWTIQSTGESFTYTEGGDKTETITNAATGCTATAILHLTINDSPEIEQTAEACTSYDWTIMGHTYNYTTGGDKTETFEDANQCTVTATLHLTIHTPETGVNTAATICDGATYTWHEVAYDEADTYYFDYTDDNNCAVQDTLVLTVNAVVPGTNTAQSICEGATYTWNNTEYATANTYYYDYTDGNNCPVQDTLVLTVNVPAAGTNTAEAICDGATYTWNNTPYTAAGTYYYDYTDGNGCAVQDTLVLTVNTPAAGTTTNEAICAGDSYVWNNQTYTTAGTYTQNTTDGNGCTVTNTLNLTVNQAQNVTLPAVTACDSYTFNGTAYTASQVITVTGTDVNGCDSTTTLNLTVNQSVTSTVALSDTGSVVYNGVTYTTDTVVTVTFTAANECDSIVTATITVIPEIQVLDSITVIVAINDATMGTITPAPGTYVYHAGDTVSFSATANQGYQFVGWAWGYEFMGSQMTDTLYTSTFEEVIDGDYFAYGITTLTFTAIFEADTTQVVDTTYYTVTLLSADTTMGTVSVGDSVMAGANFTATAYPVSGYNFVAWMNGTDTASTENPYTFTVNADITLTATFEVDTTYVPETYYYITIISADTTMGTVAPSDSAAAGSRFTAYAIANEGYVFTAWTGVAGDTISSENPYIFDVVSDITLIANFVIDSTPVIDTVRYTITVNYDATMGTVTGAGSYVEGTLVTLRATANEGYRFLGWVMDNDTVARTDTYMVVVNNDITLTAAFAAEQVYYTVVGQSNNPDWGYVTGSSDYAEGATATLIAHANPGYRFDHWSNGSTDSILTFIVTEDVTVIAYFVEETQAIDEADMENVTIYSAESRIVVSGAEGKTVNVYDINGRRVSTQANAAETVEFRMTATGVYLVKVGNAPAKRVLVVR